MKQFIVKNYPGKCCGQKTNYDAKKHGEVCKRCNSVYMKEYKEEEKTFK